MRRVLSVTPECAPLVKTGGLADVAGALPGALAPLGWDMRSLLPGYPALMATLGPAEEIATEPDLFGGPARVLAAEARGLALWVLDAPHLYDRPGGPYADPAGRDWPDNPERFAALSWMAARLAQHGAGGWRPEVVHCHDWQAGLTPYYLRGGRSGVPAILTIHNVAFQGLAPADRLGKLRLDPADYTPEGLEYWGQISALKAGVVFADKITTVSPTYAREIRTAAFGMGLEGLLRARQGDLSGILNGIDTEVWDPATDAALAAPYKTPKGKARNTAALREAFDLPEAEGPLAIVVSRLTHQKGIDLLLEALPPYLDRGGQLAVLGTGEADLERRLVAAAAHPQVGVRIGYDETLSHRMMAGGDAILVPSRFEPCGLTQLYGLRYGTIPLVAYTGGLVDTVIDATPMALRAGVATGLQFHPATADALSTALLRLVELHADRPVWTRMQQNAMRQKVGWDGSAAEYAALYAAVAG